jgi:hypothetical protein
MSNKTAVQLLMNELNELHPELFNVHTSKGREFLNNFSKYLDIEKQQIITAIDETLKGIQLDEDKTGFITMWGEGYYKQTYGGKNG